MTTPAFKLVEISAAGTFGTVCVAQEVHSGKLYALKVLKQLHLNRPRVIARTRDEAAMLSRIRHPGIVYVEGLQHIEDRPVVVMEWVRGVSMEELIRKRPSGLPLAVSLDIIEQSVEALAAAFAALPEGGDKPMHIIHRDIKPSNMLLSISGRVKMVDFGIARGDFEGKEAKTMSMVLGARGYLAPERLDGHDDKPSCDIYSLGICLYEFLTGRHIVLSVHKTFHAEALDKHVSALRPEGMSDDHTRELQNLVTDMCQYTEADRPSHAEVVDRIRAFKQATGATVDLRTWAGEEVLPMFRERSRVEPIDHPHYPELAFLERQARKVSRPAPPDVNAKVRGFLSRPNWTERTDELDLLLVANPHWSEEPFLDALPNGASQWWKFWAPKDRSSDEVVCILKLLRERPTARVRERAMQLRRHPDAAVSEAARELLEDGL